MNINTIKNYLRNYLRDTKFYSIFLLRPLKKNSWGKKDYTSSHFNKGEDYHLRFENLPGRKNIWNLEKEIINIFLDGRKIIDHLDFASGSGRIAKFLEKNVKKQYLLDSSKKNVRIFKNNSYFQ